MKAIIIDGYGDVSKLNEVEMPLPVPRKSEVLVEIHAVSINPIDCKIRSGLMQEKISYTFPLIPGLDVSGVVKQLGEEVTGYKVGDAVLAKTNLLDNGAYAEFVAIDEKLLARKPDNLSFAAAAALPLAGITAWQALVDFAKLKKGETVLIQGGSGGVGSLAVQFAKALGAKVITTASEKNMDFVRELGADQAIPYDKEDFVAVIEKQVDVVFDMIGGDVLARSYEVIVKGGRLVTIWGDPDPILEKKHEVSAMSFVTIEGGSHLKQIVQLAKEGKVQPVISSTFPLTEKGLREAHTLSEKGHPRGKIIIQVK